MSKKLLWLLFILLVCVGVTLRFSTSHEKVPVGCDEFGYLNLAKAMDNGVALEGHTSRPYLNKLLDTLRGSGISENEIAWMITPHAYHLIPNSYKIINQYPPGTSALLYLMPIEFRKILFPALAMFLMIIFPLIAAAKDRMDGLSWFHPVFAAFIFLVTVSAPFLTELTRVNSLAYTFGLLLAAGMLLKKYPFWSCFLIALTVNFRVANLLMVIPVFLFTQSSAKQMFAFKNIVSFVICALMAVLPLMIYNYFVTGNPVSSTYSAIDTSFSTADRAMNSIHYYLSWDQYWFRIHLFAIAALIGISLFLRHSIFNFMKMLIFPIVNYIFFFFHSVNMDYYPYASAILLIGVAFGMLTEFNFSQKFLNLSSALILILAAVIAFSGVSRYMKRDHTEYRDAINQYSALCKYDVVWADLYSGTAEYVCNNNGFRYGTTTPRARIIALKFLQQNNFKQAILLDDNTVKPDVIVADLKMAGLLYQTTSDSTIGKFIVIE